MDADERESATEVGSIGLPPPWYEKAFKIQMLLLLTAVAIGGPLFLAFGNIQPLPRFPWLVAFTKWFLAIAGPIVGGGMAIQMFRNLLWLFGRGPFVATWIGPPPRANCVIVGLFSPVLVGIGLDVGGIVAIVLAIMAGLFLFFSVAGFLYAQSEARKSC